MAKLPFVHGGQGFTVIWGSGFVSEQLYVWDWVLVSNYFRAASLFFSFVCWSASHMFSVRMGAPWDLSEEAKDWPL